MVARSAHMARRFVGRVSRGDWLPVVRRMGDEGSVGLTFDDGPTPETTPALLELLRDAQASATFFLTGTRAAAAPDLVGAIVAAGHAVYAHGWEHLRYDEQPRPRMLADLLRTEAVLQRFRPTPCPYLVRLPYAAGLAVGFWSGAEEIRANWAADRRWDPTMDPQRREELYAQWRKAVTRTLNWVD